VAQLPLSNAKSYFATISNTDRCRSFRTTEGVGLGMDGAARWSTEHHLVMLVRAVH
jgi:hypothetical protein